MLIGPFLVRKTEDGLLCLKQGKKKMNEKLLMQVRIILHISQQGEKTCLKI